VSVIPTIDLKSAKTFALTAVGGITNTGADAVSINGDVGTTGHDVTGFAAGAITGYVPSSLAEYTKLLKAFLPPQTTSNNEG